MLLSGHVERVRVSLMQDFFREAWPLTEKPGFSQRGRAFNREAGPPTEVPGLSHICAGPVTENQAYHRRSRPHPERQASCRRQASSIGARPQKISCPSSLYKSIKTIKNKPAAQAAGADPSRCNSTNRQNPPLK